MSRTDRKARFLLIPHAHLDARRAEEALRIAEGLTDMEIVLASGTPQARKILGGQGTEKTSAVFVEYDADSDADGSRLTDIAAMTLHAPVVIAIGHSDLVAMHRLGRVANVSHILGAEWTAAEVRRALAYARGAYEHFHANLAQRRVAQDATKARDRMATSHATLERWAAELEIANARLREVDDLKTKFLSEVSHEIRTPLAAVVSAAKIIIKHHATKPEVVPRFGNTILCEGERLTRLLNEFLDLTKIEAGCIEWQDGEVDASGLAEDALAGMAAFADEKGITLVHDVEAQLPRLQADRDRLIQVLSNLLMNALKYTPRDGRITLRARRDGTSVRFEVEDTGPGIAAAELPKVFDRFHQVRRSDDRESGRKGTGLGLCICREIIDHYGGEIWVESTVGQGSVFQFSLPVEQARASTAKASKDVASRSQRVRVLLLTEDDALAHGIAGSGAAAEIDWAVCGTVDSAVDLVSARRTDVAVVASDIVDRLGDDILTRIQSYGVPHVLLLSAEHGLVEAGVLENSDAVARSLAAIAARGSRVMVVEDDDHYRSLLEFQLTDEGYEVAAFDNGRDALDALDDVDPDLVVLDLIMPGIDGLTMLQRIRAIDPRLPAVVLTAMDDPAVAVAARELGAIGVFRKDAGDTAPYRTVVARVRRIVLEALEAPRLTAEAAR
jgi:signal transduction histidine kinase/DNA-binding response OmpR family regulator